MTSLKLSLLGTPQVELDGTPVTIRRSKVLALLVYLAVSGEPQRRDTLATLLWPDSSQSQARKYLRNELSILNRTLGGVWLDIERETVGLRTGAWLDVRQFQQALDTFDTANPTTLANLGQAIDLYRADFLTGFTLADCPDFDEWHFFQSESLRQAFATVLEQAVRALQDQHADKIAIPHARRWLALDPLHEPAHQTLMRLYALSGQQAAALRQYQICVDTLARELGVEPDQATTALYERIKSGELRKTPPVASQQSFLPDDKPMPPKHNLPHRLTSFIGREQEIETVRKLVARHRLVMLTGVGGIGKTNLSLQVGQSVLETFPDGVWLVELAAIAEASLVPQVTAIALGLRESASRSVLDYLLDYLQEKECLLILDNCEHLIDAVAQFVQTILQACAQVKILASSREALGVAGERLFHLPSLTVPVDDQQSILETWPQYDAIRLFVERAQTVLPNFDVTAANQASIIHICRQLDGIPLALELAAARVKLLTTAQIAERLDDRFRLLTSGSRTALPRQQTLRALIDWSWQLLSASEQRLLQRLSIFTGGMNLEAVEAICACDGLEAADILDLLAGLVNKSLVIAKREQGQETRYRLLETIRHYAQERLAEAGEAVAFHHHHLVYFRDFAETVAPLLKKPEQALWLNRLETDLDNMRAALDWAKETGIEAGLRLIAALAWFCWSRGNIREMEARLSHLLSKSEAVPIRVKADALWTQGLFHNHFTQQSRAIAIFKESLALYRDLGNHQGIVYTCCYLGFALKQQGVIEESQAVLQEGLTVARASGDPAALAASLDLLADQGSLDSPEEAWALMKESEALYRELGDASGLVMVLNHLGGLAMKQGEFATARSLIGESVALQEALGTEKIIYALINLGVLHSHLGDYALAQATLEKALFIIQQMDFPLHDDLRVLRLRSLTPG